MTMSINKSWSVIIILFTVLLSGSYSPAVPPPQEPPSGPTISEEERERAIDRLRERLLQNQQQGGNPQGFPGGRDTQGFPGGMFPQINPQQPTPAPAAQSNPETVPQQVSLSKTDRGLILNIKNMDLSSFIQQIAELLGMTPLLIDPEVRGTVTIHSSEAMLTDEVRAIFQLVLKTNNASLVEDNGIFQVIPISSALKTGIELIQHPAPDAGSETTPGSPEIDSELPSVPKLTTNVIRVEFIPVNSLVQPIEQWMTDGGKIGVIDRLNMLILMDYEDSVDRILKIIRVLDHQYMDKDLIDLIEIKNNASADIAADLTKMFGDGTENSATGISFVSLDRLNAIFVMASSKRALSEVRYWIDILDTTTGRSVQINEYIVQKSTASNIATLLYNLYGGDMTSQPSTETNQGLGALLGGQGTTTNQQRGSFGSVTNTGSISGLTQGRTTGTMSSSGSSFGTSQLNPQLNTTEGVSSIVIQSGEASGLQDTVRMVVDDISNRLIIQSTAADYRIILEAIELMDVMPLQVNIHAQVYEVDLTDDLSFGVGAAIRERTGGSLTEAGLNLSTTDGIPAGSLTAANIALVGNSQEVISALNALRSKTNVKVLHAPSVLAMDGTMAAINVGNQIPTTTSLYYQNNSENPTQSVTYRDTGVTLQVLPHISASGSVTLEILQEVSSVGTVTELGPTFTQSKVTCTLNVKDGETVAIAGLILDSHGLTRTGFPLISDIPIIGSLFGQTSRTKSRSEYIFLLTPTVIKDPDEFKEFSQKFKDSMKDVRRLADDKDKQIRENLQSAIDDRKKAEEQRLREEEEQRYREERAKARTRE